MTDIDTVMKELGAYPVRDAHRRNPADADIAAFEDEIGGRLPDDYRAFLKSYGEMALRRGGIYPIDEPCALGRRGRIGRFLGFATGGNGIVEATLDTFAGRIPDETIPIADDGLGNLILLGFEGAVHGKVWLWDHEHSELAGRLNEIASDLRAKGVDTASLDPHAMIWHWERLYPDKREKPPGYGNLCHVADTFSYFMASLKPDRDDEND